MTSNRLDKANIELGKELWIIQSSLDIYTLITLNAEAINSGEQFLAFVRDRSLDAMVLGLAKVFEKEEKGAKARIPHELCSVRGVYRLAKNAQPKNITAVQAFAGKYGITPSKDWVQDVDQIFTNQEPWICREMEAITWVRKKRVAHIEQNTPTSNLLPSIAAFEDLLGFAFDVHSFVNDAFLGIATYPMRQYRQIRGSLRSLLKKIGVSQPRLEFEDL